MNLLQHSGPGPPPTIIQQPQKAPSDRLVTGPSCRALKTAVSALYSVDDFIKEKIGSGFFSEVYKVTHKTTGNVMVLKMNQLRSNRPNMLREVQLLNKLSHPNILRLMGVCVQEGQLHALTEYINGGSLEQLLANKDEELTPSIKIRLALGIARGMAYVHDSDVFHRDLTSKNVLIRKYPDGVMETVVGDFGLASKIPRKCKTRLDTVGSPYWMSPECLNGQWYDQTSDIFSFGIVSCEIIARIEADPDILPRTDSFGLDYLKFVELCPLDTPPVFLRLAFYCCTYDPKSRPTFNDLVKKLNHLSDKKYDANIHNLLQSQLSTSTKSTSHHLSVKHNSNLNNNNNINSIFQNNNNNNNANNKNNNSNNKTNNGKNNNCTKRNSIDANYTPSESSDEDDCTMILRSRQRKSSYAPLQHRRSLSENVIVFPPHTTPSDKARCHLLNRQNSKTINESIVSEPEIICPKMSLRKVAETMFLLDPQYKPRLGGDPSTKLNPFTTLAQLRGVKKILGANPSTYTTAGVGDLFSSCFEMSSPFLKELSIFQKLHNTKTNYELLPKSLPTSPNLLRKDYKIDKSIEEKLLRLPGVVNAKNNHIEGFTKINGVSEYESTSDNLPTALTTTTTTTTSSSSSSSTINTNNNINTNNEMELIKNNNTGTIKKCKVNSLFSHPLFKNGQSEDIFCSNFNISTNINNMSSPTSPTKDEQQQQQQQQLQLEKTDNETIKNNDSLEMNNNNNKPLDQNDINCYETSKIYTRRGSSESGFFSSLNEDFSTYRPICNCIDKLKTHLNLETSERLTMCRCCIYSNGYQHSNTTLNDTVSNGVLMLDDLGQTVSNSIRSVDDLELSDSMVKRRYYNQQLNNNNNNNNSLNDNPNNINCLSNIDLDTRSIDMDLINRLALDSEINSMIQKNHQFTNQLLYCQNRTSSIYTDSSDDISSLAGSDSLLWDDRSFRRIPYTRSAQIAKIVEYFERKGQTFKPTTINVPESMRSTTTTPSSSSSSRQRLNSFTDCFSDYHYHHHHHYHNHHHPHYNHNYRYPDYQLTPSTTSIATTTKTSSSSSLSTTSGSGGSGGGGGVGYLNRKYGDLNNSNKILQNSSSTMINSDYERFCLELDKRPTQQRLMVCDGAVKSKLQIFDKLNGVKQQISTQREQ